MNVTDINQYKDEKKSNDENNSVKILSCCVSSQKLKKMKATDRESLFNFCEIVKHYFSNFKDVDVKIENNSVKILSCYVSSQKLKKMKATDRESLFNHCKVVRHYFGNFKYVDVKIEKAKINPAGNCAEQSALAFAA